MKAITSLRCLSRALFVRNGLQGFLGPTRSAAYLTSPNLLTHHSSPHPMSSIHLAPSSSFLLLPMKGFYILFPFARNYFSTFYHQESTSPLSTNSLPSYTYSSFISQFKHHFQRYPIQSLKTFCFLIILYYLFIEIHLTYTG